MDTLRRKQYQVLGLSTLAFAANFAVWTVFAVIGVKIKAELGLSETQFGILVATPILTGSLSRLPLGILTDRYGGRPVFLAQMLLTASATFGLSFATQYWHFLATGLCVGLAGGSFAIGIAYTSAWFEKKRQGTAMGIFGAGNAGAAITNLAAPIILVAYGWQMVPKVYAVALVAIAILFWLFTYDDPTHARRRAQGEHVALRDQLAPLRNLQVWRFGLYYFFVFGGFVALALWLPKYYVAEYQLDLKTASFITLLFTLPSGLIRALGGWASDRFGARIVNWSVFWVCLVALFLLSYPQTTMIIHGIDGDVHFAVGLGVWSFTALVFVVGIAMGVGKASVYRLIADYYPENVGSVGGLVGVIGGLGGFSLPIIFGLIADLIGVRSSCFMVLFVLVAISMLWMYFAIRELEGRKQLHERFEGPQMQPLRPWRPDDVHIDKALKGT